MNPPPPDLAYAVWMVVGGFVAFFVLVVGSIKVGMRRDARRHARRMREEKCGMTGFIRWNGDRYQ